LNTLAPRREHFYFRAMKRLLISLFVVLAAFLKPMPTLFAQDQAESAAAIAVRQDAEERYQRLSASIQELQSANASLQKKVNFLNDELQRARDESIRSNSSFATKDELNRLTEKLREVDQKRESDNKRILEALENLAKTPPPVAAAPKSESERRTKPKTDKSASAQTEKGYWYEVKPGQKLEKIIQAYREKGIKVTMQQIKEANPDMNPNKVLAGQKIFIPDPSQK
jgi:LysM repeat protein